MPKGSPSSDDLDYRPISITPLLSKVLGSLLFILYTSELFHIDGNHIVVHADDTTIYAVIPKPLSRPRVMEFLNQDRQQSTPSV